MQFSTNKKLLIKSLPFEKSIVVKLYAALDDIADDICNRFIGEPNLIHGSSLDFSSANSRAQFNSIDDFAKHFSPNTEVQKFTIYLSKVSEDKKGESLLYVFISCDISAKNEYEFYLSASSCQSQIIAEEALNALCLKIQNIDLFSMNTDNAPAPIDVRVTSSNDERAYQEKVSILDHKAKLWHVVIGCLLTFALTLLATKLGVL